MLGSYPARDRAACQGKDAVTGDGAGATVLRTASGPGSVMPGPIRHGRGGPPFTRLAGQKHGTLNSAVVVQRPVSSSWPGFGGLLVAPMTARCCAEASAFGFLGSQAQRHCRHERPPRSQAASRRAGASASAQVVIEEFVTGGPGEPECAASRRAEASARPTPRRALLAAA